MTDYTALTPLVKRVADSVHSSFPAHHSKEDTESALWIWLFENKNTVKHAHDTEALERNLYSLMTRVARAHLMKEDAATYGYSDDDVFNYSTELIKTLLESVFDYEDWQSFGSSSDGQPKFKVQSNMTGDRVAMLADVKSALDKLKPEHYQVLYFCYGDGLSQKQAAEWIGITPNAVKLRLGRAVQALRKQLGYKSLSDFRSGFSGRTEPSGNASAIAQVERDYEG